MHFDISLPVGLWQINMTGPFESLLLIYLLGLLCLAPISFLSLIWLHPPPVPPKSQWRTVNPKKRINEAMASPFFLLSLKYCKKWLTTKLWLLARKNAITKPRVRENTGVKVTMLVWVSVEYGFRVQIPGLKCDPIVWSKPTWLSMSQERISGVVIPCQVELALKLQWPTIVQGHKVLALWLHFVGIAN